MAVHLPVNLVSGQRQPSSNTTQTAGSKNKMTMKRRNGTSTVLLLVVIVLLGAQFLFTQNSHQLFGDALLSRYTEAFYSRATSAGDNSYTSAPVEPGTLTLDGILTGHYDVCIAGAGLSGSVLAERYANVLNKKVLVVEKRNHIGGNCFDYQDEDTNIRVSQYGAHLFHTIHEDVWNYVQRFGQWTPYEHKVRGIVNQKYVPIPVNIETVNTLFRLNITNQQQMDQWLKNEQIPIPDGRTPQNSEEVALSRVGQRLYDLIFKPYTFKQWNKYPSELGPEVLERIPVRNNFDERYFSDPYQALPTHGYTSLFENMLKSRHITVITNSDYFKIRDKVSCGKHYFTGPIDAYFAHHNMPKLEYRSLSFQRRVARNTKFFQPAFVVNHPQDDDDYTRIVEYKHLYNQSHLPHTVYFIERSSDYGEPYYPVPNQRNKDLYQQYQTLAQQEEQNKNVSFVGRLASYKYFNMDQAIKAALQMFEKHTGIPYDMMDHGTISAAAVTTTKTATTLEAVRKDPQLLRLISEKIGLMKADWQQAMDCSAWDNMCFATQQAKNQYKPYPFPLSRHLKNLEDFDHQPMVAVPSEWKKALGVQNSLDKPPPRQVEYIYPPEVALADEEQCLKAARKLSWQEQVRRLLQTRVQREPTTNMTAFTISDYNYAEDMIHDVFEMNDRIVGFPKAFFMVAIDEKTLEMACRFGYPVVAWTSAVKKDIATTSDTEELKHAVANTKFEVSLELIKQGNSFFFYEMDVWFLRSPKDLIAYYHHDDKHDMLFSSHMNCPMCINIGVYSVTANERTKEYFELSILMAKESPGTHDQWIMAQLLHLAENKHEGRDTPPFSDRWEPPPKTNPPPMHYPPYHGFYNPHEMVANERPVPAKNTYAIHPLSSKPLMKPFGKKILAKELGAWTGFTGPNGDGGYYARTGERRRYLLMDGHDMPNAYSLTQNFDWLGWESELFHDEDAFKWTMAALLALSRRTGRSFVMPRILADHGVHYLWTLLDFEPVEEMGIDYRETNFIHNSKSWNSEGEPFGSVARTAMGPIGKEGTMYVQYPSSGPGRDDGEIKAWKLDDAMGDMAALDAWWAMHTAIPEVDSAELLFVNPHFIDRSFVNKIRSNAATRDYVPSVAERELREVFSRLKWCTDGGQPIVIFEWIIGRSSPDYACHGKGK